MTKPPAMPEFTRVLVNVQGGESHSTEAQYMGEDIGYMVRVPREWLPAALQSAQPAEVSDESAYNLIDRFLRNNLHDDDYAEYSQALDILALRPRAVPMSADKMIQLLGEHYDGPTDVQANAFYNGLRAAEAHHGITQRADGVEKQA